jgi:hypothetical protein
MGEDFGTLTGTEKIKTFPALNSAGGQPRLLAAKSPYIYSFASNDGWSSVTLKKFTRKEIATVSLTSMFEYTTGENARGVYATSAYFDEGSNGGRSQFPAYKVDKKLLQ